MRSLPIRKDDEVQIVRGKHAKEAVAKVTSVYRRRYCIHVDRIIKEKMNGAQVSVPIHPSKVQITKLKLDKDRKALIERKKVCAFYANTSYLVLFIYSDVYQRHQVASSASRSWSGDWLIDSLICGMEAK